MLRHSVFIVESNQNMEEIRSDDNLNQSFSPENSESEQDEKESLGMKAVNPDDLSTFSTNENSKDSTAKTESTEIVRNDLPISKKYKNLSSTFHDKCEFCEKIFDTKRKNNRGLIKRYHIYSCHFKNEIDSEIDWNVSNICPVNNCTFSTKSKGNLINHYIGATHGILDKYINAKRKIINQKEIASNVDNIADKKCTTTEDTLTEVKLFSGDSQDDDGTDHHNLSFKTEVDQEMILTKQNQKSCELCGFLFNSKNKTREWHYHLYSQHFKEKFNQEIVIPKNPPFSCSWNDCELQYNSRLGLLVHCFSHHKILDKYLKEELKNVQDSTSRNTEDSNIDSTNANPVESDFPSEKNIKNPHPKECQLCGKSMSVNGRVQHMYQNHFKEKFHRETDLPLDSLPLTCPWNGCSFRSNSKQRIVLILHHFNTHGFLQKYLKEDLEKRDYNLDSECKRCQKPKSNSEKLCSECLEKFIQFLENNQEYHYQCLVCDKVFDEKSEIVSHIDEIHWSETESENIDNKTSDESVQSKVTLRKNGKGKQNLEKSLQTLKVKIEKVSRKNRINKNVAESEKAIKKQLIIQSIKQKTLENEKVSKQLNKSDYVIPPEEIKSEKVNVSKPDFNLDATSSQDHTNNLKDGSHDILKKRPKPRPKSKQIDKQNEVEDLCPPPHKKSRGFNDNKSRISNDFSYEPDNSNSGKIETSRETQSTPMRNEIEVIDTKKIKKEESVFMELYICPICEVEGIFRSHDKVQTHLSGFHNLPLDKQIAYGVLPQKKKLL